MPAGAQRPCDVAVLCVTPRSHYKKMAGCDCYDAARNAFTFPGGLPVVAHPPCRSWSRMRHFVKADVRIERELAYRCIDWVREFGGVLEHPKKSTLWLHCRLPLPCEKPDKYGGFSIELDQHSFGHKTTKSTWLYICGIDRAAVPEIPLNFNPVRKHQWEHLSMNQRRATPPAFASWLVELARRCGKGGAA